MSLFLFGLVLISEPLFSLRGYSILVVCLRILFFSSQGVLLIYIIFELLSLPVLIMIHIYGSQPEKIGSVYYILFYTGRFGIRFLYIVIVLER